MKYFDAHGRSMRKLRVSLLDACNFRCFYCMPLSPKFMKRKKYLSPIQIEKICKELVLNYGIEQIRVTGGEPTLRHEFRDIVSRLANLPIKSLGLTTNGLLLTRHLEFLKEKKCFNINISLDSLKKDKFNSITRTNNFDTVYDAILKTKELGFNIKINTVLMRGQNDDEIYDFVEFSEKYAIQVRFLEVMKIGQVSNPERDLLYPAAEAIKTIEEKYSLKPLTNMETDSTSFNFMTENGGNIGFIASETQPFCGSCSRWRLTAEGVLRACLMSTKGLDLKEVKAEDYEEVIQKVLAMKPAERINAIRQDMHKIGG